MKMLLIYISLFIAPIYGLPQNAFADCSPENGTTSPVSAAAAAPLVASSEVVGQVLATNPPASAPESKTLAEKGKELGLNVLHSLSANVEVASMKHYETSIWWQQGEPDKMSLVSPAASIQATVKAKSIPGLDGFKNPFVSSLVDRTSFNAGYYRFCLLDCRSEAQATSSGYSDPRTNPTYQWSGKGYAHGSFVTIQEELPFNLFGKHVPFYIAAGVNDNKNQWRMDVHTATCTAAETKLGYTCPKSGPGIYYDKNGSFLGEVVTLGVHLNDNAAIELSDTSVSDNNWASNPAAIPPIWHDQATSLGVKFSFK